MLSDQEIADHVLTLVKASEADINDKTREVIVALAANLLRNINDIAAATRGIRDDMP
jgi:hypothetical protein